MMHSQHDPFTYQFACRRSIARQAHPLLERHPVLLPVLLLAGAVLFSFISSFADGLFPLLALLGMPTTLLCLLIAFVLGTCGVLTLIIGTIEYIERSSVRVASIPRSKEHSYDCN